MREDETRLTYASAAEYEYGNTKNNDDSDEPDEVACASARKGGR